MDILERAQKLVADIPTMTARKYVDESCSLIADMMESYDLLKDSFDANAEETIEVRNKLTNACNRIIGIEKDLDFAYKRAKVLADLLGIPVHESPEVTGTILGLVRGAVERLIAERDLFKKETVALASEVAGSVATGIMYLVCAQWEHEGNEDLVAFRDRASAEEFVSVCEEYQDREPDDDEDGTKWENSHPGKPYLSVGGTLRWVESFVVIEVPVL